MNLKEPSIRGNTMDERQRSTEAYLKEMIRELSRELITIETKLRELEKKMNELENDGR